MTVPTQGIVATSPPPQPPESPPEISSTSSEDKNNSAEKMNCCVKYFNFGGVPEARGYNTLGIGRGALVMSNIVLSTALIELASTDAGCDINDDTECDEKIYGFTPASLISNIAVISGLLSAFLMPMTGAIVDFTPYRRMTGILAAAAMIVIQAIQIGTVQSTWFIMAILQAIAGFLYQVEVVATYAYLPDISRIIGEMKMTTYSSKFTLTQFMAQNAFLILVGGIGFAFGLNDVVMAQMGQGINVVWSIIFFWIGWKLLPSAPAKKTLAEGESLWTVGFQQNWETIQNINRNYSRGLKWFLLAVVFAEASANAFTTVSVIYLTENLGFNGTEIIVFFLVTLFATAAGTRLASFVTMKTNPNTSWQLSMVSLFVFACIGALTLDGAKRPNIAYLWGVSIGVMLGWFYPTENLFFSMCLPKGSEAEMSGFFVYCTQILGWLPPLLFSILVENKVQQKYGVIVTAIFLLIAVGILRCAAPWEEILEEAKQATCDQTTKVDIESPESSDEKKEDYVSSVKENNKEDSTKAKTGAILEEDVDLEEVEIDSEASA